MASKAKRYRQKLEREGKRNPAWNRGDWNGMKPITRMTPTKAEKTKRVDQKHKPNFTRQDGESSVFYLGRNLA